jgi:hypothetical protein
MFLSFCKRGQLVSSETIKWIIAIGIIIAAGFAISSIVSRAAG